MRRVAFALSLVLAILAAGCRFPGPVMLQHRADLVVASVGDPPTDGTAVDSFVVPVSTANTGRVSANRSVTRLFLSLDDHLTVSDIALGDVQVPRLRRGSLPYETSLEVSVPASVEPVAYHVLACADALHRVRERYENNNCRASAGTISFAEPPPPPPGEGSSQALIAQDLEAGVIDYPKSLEYRTLALFRDPQLPARYGAIASSGEDQMLFAELESEFASLPADVQAEITPYVVPPNDPASAFGPAPAAQPAMARTADVANEPDVTRTQCGAPASWIATDWAPPAGGDDDGFRIWICAADQAQANLLVQPVIAAASSLWEPMTRVEPDGMGKPVPDTANGNTQNFGNGKIDIFILYTSDCVDRVCPLFNEQDPNGSFNLGTEVPLKNSCHAPGHPARSCSAYLAVNAGLICPTIATGCSNTRLKGVLAHEFFHVLQDAHNRDAFEREAFRVNTKVSWDASWYYEASATWAGWHYARTPNAYARFIETFQPNNQSLLDVANLHPYGSWVWPLLMHQAAGASSVFGSWREIESATTPKEVDDALDRTFGFTDNFRDLSVRNVNPSEYFADNGVGLERDVWQTALDDFPQDPHLHDASGVIGVGDQENFVEVAGLASDVTEYTVQDAVREVTIDVSSLVHADTADIDVVGRLEPKDQGGAPTWRRLRRAGTKVTFCRDEPAENFDLVYVVLSNHGRARTPLAAPDENAALSGTYHVTGKSSACIPDGLEGTVNWTYSFESDSSGGGEVSTISAVEHGTMRVHLVRDPTFPDTFEHIDDGTSSFSIDFSRTDEGGDSHCFGTSTATGTANGTFSTYHDPYSRASFLNAQVAGLHTVFDQDTKYVVLIGFIPFQEAGHSENSGTSCSGTFDSTAMAGAPYNMPGSLRTCAPPGVDPTVGHITGAWNNAERQFEFGCTKSLTTADSVATLTVSGVLTPA